MASGYGFKGGPTRCFPFWQEVMACYTLSTSGDDNRGAEKCAKSLDDYNECLYHRKERKRVAELTAAYRKWEAEQPNLKKPTAGELRKLGLIDATMEEMHLKPIPFIPYKKQGSN